MNIPYPDEMDPLRRSGDEWMERERSMTIEEFPELEWCLFYLCPVAYVGWWAAVLTTGGSWWSVLSYPAVCVAMVLIAGVVHERRRRRGRGITSTWESRVHENGSTGSLVRDRVVQRSLYE
jgi:hypothetical protein